MTESVPATDTPEVAAQVEKPAEVAATDKPVETEEQKATRERDEQGRFKNSAQERIDAVVRQREEQRRETEYWRGRAEAREAKEAEAAKAKAAEKPTADKFGTYDEFVDALTDWKANQIVDDRLTKHDKAAEERRSAEQRQTTFKQRLEESSKGISDYDAVITAAESAPVVRHVGDLIQESESPAKLLYHFAKHPEVLERLNGLSPQAAAREVGRIEARFEVTSEVEKPEVATESVETAVAPKKTAAPAPAKPVGSGRSTAVNLGTASMDEYKATRKAQGARWAR